MRMKLFSLSVLVLLSTNALAADVISVNVNLQTAAVVAPSPVEAVTDAATSALNTLNALDPTTLTAPQKDLQTILTGIFSASVSEQQTALKLISPKANTANVVVTRRNPVGFNLQSMGSQFGLLQQSAKSQHFSFLPHLPQTVRHSRAGFSPYIFSATDPLEKGSLFDNRLSTFFTVNYASSKQSETQVKTAFNGGASAFTGGLDYRLNAKSYVGLAMTYADAKVDLGTGGNLNNKAFSLNTYGAYYLNENVTFLGSVGLGTMNYDMSRNIQFTANNTTTNTVASSNPDGSHYNLSLSAAYDKSFKQYSGGVFTQLNISNASISSFNETGAGGLNLHVDSQTVKSQALNLGGQFRAVYGTRWGVITPYLKLVFTHEFNKDGEKVGAYFINDPSHTMMAFNAKTQDANYFNTTLGSSFVLPRGVQGFAQLQFTQLIEQYSQTSFTVGVRKEL